MQQTEGCGSLSLTELMSESHPQQVPPRVTQGGNARRNPSAAVLACFDAVSKTFPWRGFQALMEHVPLGHIPVHAHDDVPCQVILIAGTRVTVTRLIQFTDV